MRCVLSVFVLTFLVLVSALSCGGAPEGASASASGDERAFVTDCKDLYEAMPSDASLTQVPYDELLSQAREEERWWTFLRIQDLTEPFRGMWKAAPEALGGQSIAYSVVVEGARLHAELVQDPRKAESDASLLRFARQDVAAVRALGRKHVRDVLEVVYRVESEPRLDRLYKSPDPDAPGVIMVGTVCLQLQLEPRTSGDRLDEEERWWIFLDAQRNHVKLRRMAWERVDEDLAALERGIEALRQDLQTGESGPADAETRPEGAFETRLDELRQLRRKVSRAVLEQVYEVEDWADEQLDLIYNPDENVDSGRS